MTKFEIEEEISRLKNKKSELGLAKSNVQASLADVNAKFVGRLANSDFERLRKQRAELCRMQNELERQIRPITEKIRNLSVEKDRYSQSSFPGKSTVEALAVIRDEYQQFAADKTRVASMRQMAAEFVMKLNPIIRKSVND
jgi:hypothetical protein